MPLFAQYKSSTAITIDTDLELIFFAQITCPISLEDGMILFRPLSQMPLFAQYKSNTISIASSICVCRHIDTDLELKLFCTDNQPNNFIEFIHDYTPLEDAMIGF